MTFAEYTSHIRALINDFGMRRLLTGEVPVKFRRKKNTGNIFTEAPHLTFKACPERSRRDSASFEFSENLTLISKSGEGKLLQISVPAYGWVFLSI